MAEVRIEDGKITRVFHEGRGAEVTESWLSRSGEPVSQRWAAWFEAPHDGQIILHVYDSVIREFSRGHRCGVCGRTQAQNLAINYDCTHEC